MSAGLVATLRQAPSELDAAARGLSRSRAALCLALGSFLGLYFELIAIRWLSSEFRYFAYYKNIPLIACFLGLGIGLARADRPRDPSPWFLPLCSTLAFLLLLGSGTFLAAALAPRSEEAFLGVRARGTAEQLAFYGLIVGVYVAVAGCLIPLGQGIGRWMTRFPPLAGYTLNVGASLVGVLTITGFSFLSLPPVTWYLAGSLGCVILIALVRPRLAIPSALSAILLCALGAALPADPSRTVLWSPYSKLELSPLFTSPEPVAPRAERSGSRIRYGSQIHANQDYCQTAIDLSDPFVRRHPALLRSQQAYELPFRLREPGEVLIVGAGMGNDVAAALRRGARRVVAVEIDPLIHRLGARLHPEKPYADPRVTVVTEDARAFLRKTQERFDVIVYGLLDSHSALSSMSAIRIDNFVYTIEGIRDAARRLRPGGLLSITFAIHPSAAWLRPRLVNLVREALHQDPVCFAPLYDLGFTVVAGPALAGLETGGLSLRPVPCTPETGAAPPRVSLPLPTDDWPFLYLPRRELPDIYVKVLGLVAGASLLLIRLAHPGTKRVDWHFFFLGAGFMLIETTAVTRLALVLGTTWVVNSFAFAAILGMVLLGNGLVYRFPGTPYGIPYLLLFGSLALNWLLPPDAWLSLGFVARGMLTAGLIALPLAFSAVVFARSVSTAPALAPALGSNLLGATVGGALEYLSVVVGFRMLWLVAMAVYALSALCLARPPGK